MKKVLLQHIFLSFIFPFILSLALPLLLPILPAPISYYCGLLATADAVIIIAVVTRSLHQGCAVIWTNCDEMSSLLQGWKTLVGTHGAGSGIKNVDYKRDGKYSLCQIKMGECDVFLNFSPDCCREDISHTLQFWIDSYYHFMCTTPQYVSVPHLSHVDVSWS